MNCGNILADKWRYYQRKIKEIRGTDSAKPIYIEGTVAPQTAEKQIFEELGLHRYCCRKHLLTHVDLIDKI
jgi:DNA-directed RNA polymerase I, II, and III subunit RPABC5